MPAYQYPSENIGDDGIAYLLQYLTGQIPYMIPIILFFEFIVILGAGYYAQHKKTGNSGHLAMWCSISSFITTTGAIILYLIPNVLDIVTVGICIGFTFLFTLWFLFSHPDS